MVIKTALKYLVEEINSFYSIPNALQEPFAVLGNVAKLEGSTSTQNAGLQKQVVFTLVNISEETTLRNNPYFVARGESLVKRNPTVYLNLYVLISCADDIYEEGLNKISKVVSFFQRKYVFTADTTALSFPVDEIDKIILDLHSLNIEQLNHLWGILGGKYHPSVLYRLRLLPVQVDEGSEGPQVKEIKTTENAN